MNVVSPLANWIPYRLEYIDQDWLVHWLYLGDKRMDDPFFDETIRYCRAMQRRVSRFESSSGTALLLAKQLKSLQPQAFVFHVSRCGSTLLSQAFVQSETCISISEAPLLDEILRSTEHDPNISNAQREEWFKAALSWMGQLRTGRESSYIIKLDSWHIHFYGLLREWFPEIPFFFLTRRPAEVLASHAKMKGIHMVPGLVNPSLLKMEGWDGQAVRWDFNLFAADVLMHYYNELSRILKFDSKFNRFFDYSRGAREMLESFSEFTGIELETKMYDRLKFYSKNNGVPFDTEPKVEDFSTEACKEAYEEFINAI